MPDGEKTPRTWIVLTAVLSGLVLAACGGDDPPASDRPDAQETEEGTGDSGDGAEEGADSDDASAPEEVDVGEVSWRTTPREYRGQDGSVYTYDCPGGASEDDAGPVWGSDLYTDDSSVCLAAVHAGEITFEDGGTVAVEIAPGENSYDSTEQNGVETSSWGTWSGSFLFTYSAGRMGE